MMLFTEELNKYRVVSSNFLLLLVTVYIVLLDNNSLWSLLWSAISENPVGHLLFVCSFFMFLVVLTLIILSVFSATKMIKATAVTAIILASIIAYYIDNMHVIFSVSMMHNLFETDIKESSELINSSIIFHVFIFGIVPSILVLLVKIKKKPAVSELVSRIKLLSVMLLVTTLSVLWTSKDYAFILRENREIRYLVNPVFPVVSLYKYFTSNSINSNRPIEAVFSDAAKFSTVSSGVKRDLLVIVVGETARASNFSLNGYSRETNPLLIKEDIVNFSDTSSCGTATAESVPCMFSDLDKSEFSVNKAKYRENLLDAFITAGIDVLWRENNSSCKGVCTRVTTEDLTKLREVDLCDTNECYDEILLHKLDEYVNSLTKDGVLVLHQQGSHGPTYYKRHPKIFSKFKPECDLSSVHDCNQNEVVNAYDNTILYTDYFLSKVIEYLKLRTDKFNTAMIYMSDHGESLGENGVYLHGLPYFIAPQEQTHVPFILWLSDSMKRQKHIDYECLKNNSNGAYSHDNLVHSSLGLMDVMTSVYVKSKDVFANCRQSNLVDSSPFDSLGTENMNSTL